MTQSRLNQSDQEHRRLVALFPNNPFLLGLVDQAEAMGVRFAASPLFEQWLYHPEHRTIYVWEPDLKQESLSYLVVVLAHELGHVVDFDKNPRHQRIASALPWFQVPHEIEAAAFVHGFRLLKELWVPVSLDAYLMMIEPALAPLVRERIEKYHICCLMSADATVQAVS